MEQKMLLLKAFFLEFDVVCLWIYSYKNNLKNMSMHDWWTIFKPLALQGVRKDKYRSHHKTYSIKTYIYLLNLNCILYHVWQNQELRIEKKKKKSLNLPAWVLTWSTVHWYKVPLFQNLNSLKKIPFDWKPISPLSWKEKAHCSENTGVVVFSECQP